MHDAKSGDLPEGRPPFEGGSAAATAAAEEQQNDEDDPDPVVVVEYVAQAVVHREPPYGMNLEWEGAPSIPSPLSEYVEASRLCGIGRDFLGVCETCRTVLKKFFQYLLTKPRKWYIMYRSNDCGYSLMVKLQLPKLAMRVRFPLLAPTGKDAIGRPFLLERVTVARNRFRLPQKRRKPSHEVQPDAELARRGSDSRYSLQNRKGPNWRTCDKAG